MVLCMDRHRASQTLGSQLQFERSNHSYQGLPTADEFAVIFNPILPIGPTTLLRDEEKKNSLLKASTYQSNPSKLYFATRVNHSLVLDFGFQLYGFHLQMT